jgi:hypothetical protein
VPNKGHSELMKRLKTQLHPDHSIATKYMLFLMTKYSQNVRCFLIDYILAIIIDVCSIDAHVYHHSLIPAYKVLKISFFISICHRLLINETFNSSPSELFQVCVCVCVCDYVLLIY